MTSPLIPPLPASLEQPRPLRVAVLGCGTVGTHMLRLMHAQADELAARIGAPLELAGIAVRRLGRDRGDLSVDPDLFTTDAHELIEREDVDIVVEMVGGIEPARSWLTSALKAGKSVVTANKALLAEDGAALQEAAIAGGADLYYEAAVAGAIPLLRPLRESLHGDRIDRVAGIVNGTCNYILSNMDAHGMSFGEALTRATELGYAEPDPTADVEGFDAAAKGAIIASLAFHTRVTAHDVYREGISDVTPGDIASAKAMGCTVKLLCVAERTVSADGRSGVSVRVHPAMIPRDHPLAGVGDAFNAVFVEAEAAGQLMFYGRGAGGAPTASAVLGDVVAVARNRLSGRSSPRESTYAALPVHPMGESITRYYVCLDVADRAGVLSAVAAEFAAHDVSIATVRQESCEREGRRPDTDTDTDTDDSEPDALLIIVTHAARNAALSATVAALRQLPVVRNVISTMRVERKSEPS